MQLLHWSSITCVALSALLLFLAMLAFSYLVIPSNFVPHIFIHESPSYPTSEPTHKTSNAVCSFKRDPAFELLRKRLVAGLPPNATARSVLPFSSQHSHLRVPPENWSTLKQTAAWNQCLPMSSRICDFGTKYQIVELGPHGTSKQNPVCFSAVLHLLLEDTWKAIQNVKCSALLFHGTLLGSVRDKRIIPHTEDVDIGFIKGECDIAALRKEMWSHGLFMFERDRMMSWCVTPDHDLASYLYDPNFPTVQKPRGPTMVSYGDVYNVKKNPETGAYTADQLKGSILAHEAEPFGCSEVHSNEYTVWADPSVHLQRQYGQTYMKVGKNGRRN